MELLKGLPSLPHGFPVSLQVVAATLVLGIIYSIVTKDRPYTGFPIITVDGLSPKSSWLYHGRRVLAEGVQQVGQTLVVSLSRTNPWQCSGAFQIITGTGPKIVLPNRFADELRNHPSLNFNKAFAKVSIDPSSLLASSIDVRQDLFVNYPGFEAHKQGLYDDSFIQETVRVKLTQSLGRQILQLPCLLLSS